MYRSIIMQSADVRGNPTYAFFNFLEGAPVDYQRLSNLFLVTSVYVRLVLTVESKEHNP